jgi:hypothetical protein
MLVTAVTELLPIKRWNTAYPSPLFIPPEFNFAAIHPGKHNPILVQNF